MRNLELKLNKLHHDFGKAKSLSILNGAGLITTYCFPIGAFSFEAYIIYASKMNNINKMELTVIAALASAAMTQLPQYDRLLNYFSERMSKKSDEARKHFDSLRNYGRR